MREYEFKFRDALSVCFKRLALLYWLRCLRALLSLSLRSMDATHHTLAWHCTHLTVLKTAATYHKLTQHQSHADTERKTEIDQQEGAAAILATDIRETPDIAQSHRRTDGCHDGAQTGRKRISGLFG